MNILIVTHYFPPEPHRLIEELAGTLKDFGHTVRVLTGFPNWPSGRLHPDYPVRFLRRETLSGVEVFRAPVYPDHSRSAIKRMVNLLSLAVSATVIAPFAVPRCDVVWVISPPTLALPGWLLSRLWRVPLIYDVLDMWPETLSSTQMMKSSWSGKVVGWFMNRIYRACASIRVVTPGFRNDLIGKGVAAEKVHYVPNFVDTEFYAPRANESPGERGTLFRVIYAGNIGSSQGLGAVLDAADILRDMPGVEFVLAGDGVDLPALRVAAADRRLENVKFLGRLAPSEMPLLYSTADALLVHLSDEPIHRITIPHKTLAYLAAGKPVIAAVRGDVAEVVCTAEAGIACEPDCGMALAQAVKELAAMPQGARLKLGQNARAAACREYSRVAVVRKLEEICRNALETSRVSRLAHRSEA